MKKLKDFTLTALSIPFLIAVLANLPGCYAEPKDENKCPYEGGECPNVHKYLQDYQIQLHMDTVWIYDYDRLVGKFVNEQWDSKLDSIIMKDNL